MVRGYALSIDGFSSAAGQSLENPFGKDGLAIMDWAFQTHTLKSMFGQEGGSTGIDDNFLSKSFDNIGANIMGRNMFGPVRGPWTDEEWKGWWGGQSAVPFASICSNPPCAIFIIHGRGHYV